MNIPYLERLQNKPIPKTVKSFAINKKEQQKIEELEKKRKNENKDLEKLETSEKTDKPEILEEEIDETSEIEENSEEIIEPEIKQNFKIVDKRKDNKFEIDYDLILKRIKEKNIVEKNQSGIREPEIININNQEIIAEPADQPERVKIKIIKKKKIVIENNDVLKNIPENPIEPEKVGEPLSEVREIVKIKIPKRKVKAISTIPIAEFNINSTKIIDRLPKKTEKIIYKASSYYMNNRKISIEKLNKLFQPYRKEILDNKETVSCEGRSNNIDFELLTHQKIVRDYLNLYTPYRGLLLYHGLGAGKCHAKGTPIMLSNGEIKLVEEIQVGDLLMGDDSKPRTVLSLARGRDKMYDIIPLRKGYGDKYTVNQEHILCLREPTEILSKDNVYEISVKDYLNLPNKIKSTLKGYRVPIEFSEKELDVDPYLMGKICKNTLKQIPDIYKCNSRKNRLLLLTGLIDNIGSICNNNGEFEIIFSNNNNKILIDDVIFVARSLGLDCQLIQNVLLQKIIISGNGIEEMPTKIIKYKKKETKSKDTKTHTNKLQDYDYLSTDITVNYVGEDDYYGFMLDGNCRYVMGDFTVTHNTCTSIAIAEGMKTDKKIYIMTPAS